MFQSTLHFPTKIVKMKTLIKKHYLNSRLNDTGDQCHSKGYQSWVFFGMNDAKAETPVLWPPHAKSWLIGKDSDAGRDWGQEEKGTTEDEMARWYHRFDRCEFEWTLGVGDGQGGLACCNSWGRKESDMTAWLNWTEMKWHWTHLEWHCQERSLHSYCFSLNPASVWQSSNLLLWNSCL